MDISVPAFRLGNCRPCAGKLRSPLADSVNFVLGSLTREVRNRVKLGCGPRFPFPIVSSISQPSAISPKSLLFLLRDGSIFADAF